MSSVISGSSSDMLNRRGLSCHGEGNPRHEANAEKGHPEIYGSVFTGFSLIHFLFREHLMLGKNATKSTVL